MRILITGGAGFIGSDLCRRFLDDGHDVICVDNLLTGSLSNIEAFRTHTHFQFIKQDVSNFIAIDGPVDYILHFASPASPIDYSMFPIQTLKVGSLGTHNALGLARSKKARFLLASTSEVYGDPEISPQPEKYWGNVNPIGPRGVYDEAKRFAEAMAVAYKRIHGIDVRIARIFNTYGPRMRRKDGRVIPNFITQALAGEAMTVYGKGTQTRSFCYIDDMVEAFSRFIHAKNPPLVLNLGNPEEFTILEAARLIKKLCRARSKLVFKALPIDDPKVRRPDIRLAKKALKWRPRISLEKGLARTIEWFKNS